MCRNNRPWLSGAHRWRLQRSACMGGSSGSEGPRPVEAVLCGQAASARTLVASRLTSRRSPLIAKRRSNLLGQAEGWLNRANASQRVVSEWNQPLSAQLGKFGRCDKRPTEIAGEPLQARCQVDRRTNHCEVETPSSAHIAVEDVADM